MTDNPKPLRQTTVLQGSKTTSEIDYALSRWTDTRRDTITREEAAQIVERWANELLPVSASADWHEGWQAACETVAMALRFRDMHL